MGRGGKKKNKQGEKVDLGLGSLSLEAGESSASAQGAPSAAGVSAGGGSVLDGGKKKEGESAQQTEPSTSQASGDTKKDDTKVEKVPPKVESVPEKIEEEESAGLGLGLGGGKKKRPKKKPAAGAATTPAAPTPAALGVTTPAFAPGPTAPAKPPASEAPGPPPGFTSTQPAGWGARGRGAPSLAPPQQAFPTAFPQQPPHQQTFPTAFPQQPPPHQTFPTAFPQQPPHQQTFPTSFPQQPPPQQTFPTAFPQQPPHQQTFPTSFPQQPPPQQTFPTAFPQQPPHQQTFPTAFPQQPPPQPRVQTPAPVFVPPPVSSGRGRGGSPTDTKISVVSSTPPVQPAKQTAVACRFQIPAKVPPSGRAPALKTTVTTNYLEMTIQPIKVNRYDVTITPDRPKKLLPKVFNAAKAKKFPKQFIAFDQRKNCYSLIPLWQGSDERISISVEILDDNDAKMAFEISLKKTGIVDLGTIINHMKNLGSSLNTPMEAIQCVDVILQQGTLESYVKAGRQFFKRPRNPIDLSTGLEMWTGLFQSAIFTSRAFINIDVAHKGFPRQQSLIDALQNDFRLNPRQPLDRQKGVDAFLHFIKGLRVKANIGGAGVKRREFICNGIADPPSRITFQLTDAAGKPIKEITVAKYFETEKKCRLRFPDLNCMWVGPRDKKIYYPMELLEVVYGQALNKQLNERQLSTMVREAATPPSDRLNKIKEVIKDMKYSENPCFKHFKMEIDNKFFQVDAKILQAPKIDVGSGRPIEPRRGVWQANRFLRAGALESWGFIVVDAIDANSCNVDNMISMIMRIGSQMGMAVNPPAFTKLNVTQMELRNVLLTAQERKLNFMFIIVSARDKDAYHKVKRKAELEVGILTQCIKEMTASRRMNEQTVRNILLKVNSKLMGVNQGLDGRSLPVCLKNGGVMVVGADVTHPSPDQMAVPSIAAVTASIDPKCFQYNIEMSIQTPKHEIIVDFENMMFDHLKIYRAHNQNALPRKIFVFRDGVSEGQFAQVMNSELVAVQRAYARHDRVNKPEILFLLVQKRHHTRFFMGDKNPQNVEPGTVVDTHIVHPKELDFYLVSHQAIKGTARPTRYHAVCNDGNIPSDEVEQLTFYLCHLYSRCTRSVSYPTPTYYAHLACFRAKSLTFGDRFDNAVLDRQPQRLRVLDKMLQCSRMFFV